MKYLILLIVAALLAVAAFLYFGSGDLAVVPPKKPAPAVAAAIPTQDFHEITTLLEKDMADIPESLDAPRVIPSNAFSVKSRLGNTPGLHQEYQVLVQAADLVIYADQEHSVRQQSVPRDTAQADWTTYRQRTAAEVHRLLASLQGIRL